MNVCFWLGDWLKYWFVWPDWKPPRIWCHLRRVESRPFRWARLWPILNCWSGESVTTALVAMESAWSKRSQSTLMMNLTMVMSNECDYCSFNIFNFNKIERMTKIERPDNYIIIVFIKKKYSTFLFIQYEINKYYL